MNFSNVKNELYTLGDCFCIDIGNCERTHFVIYLQISEDKQTGNNFMLKFRKNLIVKQVSEASTEMCPLKIGVPKLEIDGGKFNS